MLQAGPFCIFWSQNKGIKSPPPEGETHGNLQSSNPTNSLYQTGIGMTAFIQFIYCQLLDFLHVLSPRWACSNLSGCFKCCAAFISFMNIRRLKQIQRSFLPAPHLKSNKIHIPGSLSHRHQVSSSAGQEPK